MLGFEDDKPGATLDAVHINFWFVRKKFKHHYDSIGDVRVDSLLQATQLSIDIGIRWTNDQHFRGCRVVLPGKPARWGEKFKDLSSEVLKPRVAELIFARDVDVQGSRIALANGEVLHVANARAGSITESNFLDLRVDPRTSSLAPGEFHYTRFRLQAPTEDHFLLSKGWGLAKRGFVFSARINDERESRVGAKGGANALNPKNLISIDSLFAFVVAPIEYVPQYAFPSFHYTRMLEAEEWADYMDAPKAVFESNRYAVHQWRLGVVAEGPPLTRLSPGYLYTHLVSEFGFGVFFMYLLGGLIGGFSATFLRPLLEEFWALLLSLFL